MKDVTRARALAWQLERQSVEALRIAAGQLPPPLVHRVEPPQQHAPDGGLDVVEAQVEADLCVYVLVEPAVIAQPPTARRDLIVVGDDGAAVAHHGQVLRRIEGEDRGAPEGADAASLEGRAVRLRAVLQHPQAEAI